MPDSSHYLPDNEGSPEVRAIIDSFRRPDYTVAQMIVDGFTHVTGRCTNCGQIVMNPFRMMIEQRIIRSRSITLSELSTAYRCRKCGGSETAPRCITWQLRQVGVAVQGDGLPITRVAILPLRASASCSAQSGGHIGLSFIARNTWLL